jgi:hypothetical protein
VGEVGEVRLAFSSSFVAAAVERRYFLFTGGVEVELAGLDATILLLLAETTARRFTFVCFRAFCLRGFNDSSAVDATSNDTESFCFFSMLKEVAGALSADFSPEATGFKTAAVFLPCFSTGMKLSLECSEWVTEEHEGDEAGNMGSDEDESDALLN